ncbi:MAG: bifunctional 3-demethylubiquinol 3-O-methyltransferase/2-polyprenyl-6-hydroxyphenol methylase [Enterovirga sp.]|nr:bifunctional 3-demethylubiquinol 3-O-methyltransferase/2-polyprenyl-6-hydroxyphenol methylase [Enterovirga sp.]
MSTSPFSPPPRGAVDPNEVGRFDRLARDWWDPHGPMRALHRINPLRLVFIREALCRHFGRDPRAPFPLDGLSLLDVGCGAGLISEPMARLGAAVTGLDPAARNIEVARRHAQAAELSIDYRTDTVETVAAGGQRFEVVLAMEVVEHVPDMPAFVAACGAALAPGGLLLLATINRTLRSFALAIVGAEYVLRWLPRGTHDWDRFVTPDELRGATGAAGLSRFQTRGMMYDPLKREWGLSRDTSVNYLACAEKPGSPP